MSLIICVQVMLLYARLVCLFTQYITTFCSTRSSATAQKQRISCPRGRKLGPAAHSCSALYGYIYAYGGLQNPQQTYVKRAVH